MTLLIKILSGTWLFFTTPLSAQEQSFYVIVHPSNPVTALTRQQVARFFLKKTSVWDHGTPAEPVDLKSSSSIRKYFSEIVLDKSVVNVKQYWQQLIFSGKEVPPVEKASESEIVKFIESHPGGVGYISTYTPHGRCKVIEIIL